MPEIRREMENWQQGAKMIAKHGCISPLEGWKMAILWIMNHDPDRLEFLKAKKRQAEMDRLAELERLDALRDGRKHQALDCADHS
jgi:hypothetical protein